jgi:hypothetical protein
MFILIEFGFEGRIAIYEWINFKEWKSILDLGT